MSEPQHQEQNHDSRELVEFALDWIEVGYKVSLATVVSTWGSSPRPAGSQLLIREDNLFEGSISGGCIEGEVVTEALAAIRNDNFKLLDFGITDEDAWQVGLACGGKVQVFVQNISAELKSVLADLKAARSEKSAVALLINLDTGAANLHKRGDSTPDELNLYFANDQCGILNLQGSDRIFVRIFNPPLRLFIVGAVHIAQILAKIATRLGYEVVVIDPRDTWGEQVRFAGVMVDRQWPSTALEKCSPDSRTAIVTLCHDPKLDDPALLVALRSDAFYIGSLGSRKTHAKRLERLTTEGISAEGLARIKAPVGLDIGARTPAEIALSIMAEMTQTLRKFS